MQSVGACDEICHGDIEQCAAEWSLLQAAACLDVFSAWEAPTSFLLLASSTTCRCAVCHEHQWWSLRGEQ